jgi:hypothetical protein
MFAYTLSCERLAKIRRLFAPQDVDAAADLSRNAESISC